MTDRLKGLVVTLDHDIREDDAQAIIDAILMVKHVVSVQPVQASAEDQIVKSRMRAVIGSHIIDLLDDLLGDKRS